MSDQPVRKLAYCPKAHVYLLYYTESLNKSFYFFVAVIFTNNDFICSVCEIAQTLVGYFYSCISNAEKIHALFKY